MKSRILLLVGIFLLTLTDNFLAAQSNRKVEISLPGGVVEYVPVSNFTRDYLERYVKEPQSNMYIVGWKSDFNIDSLDKSSKDTLHCMAVAKTKEEYQLWQDSSLVDRLKKEGFWETKEDPVVSETSSVPTTDGYQLYLLLSILALVLSITGIVVAVILYLKKKKQFEEKVVNIVANSETFMQWRDQAATNTVQPTYTPRSSFDDGDFRDLRKRVSDLEDQLRKEQSLSTTTVSSSQKSNAPRSLYAESIVNDKFMRVKESPNEDSIFELKLQGDSRASVTIYRGSHNRILQNPSFLDGCDKQVLGHGSLTVRQEGRAEKDENGKWKLVSKVNVILNR